MMNVKLWVLPILLLCLSVSSWGACFIHFSNPGGTTCYGGWQYDFGSCEGKTCGLFDCSKAVLVGGPACDMNPPYTWNQVNCKWSVCDTQAEADSVACELKPGMNWINGVCSVPACETSCSSQKSTCTDWKDSVTYVVDAETGDTTFSCVGYCKTARMTHTDSTEAMDDSLSIIYRKNFADSVKVSYGENCVSPADTTGGGNPQEVDMTYFVSFKNVENELDTAGVSFVNGLYNQSCESTLYRGIKNGRYIFWYSPNDIPEGVTNVVRIR